MLEGIPTLPGTYLLVLVSGQETTVTVGRRGHIRLVPGYYVYIGSAFGHGGLRARIKHHYAISQSPHWHLDYLRPYLKLQEVWYSCDETRHEHNWASCMVYTMLMQIPMPGLGSSDCRCESHLFYVKKMPEAVKLKSALQQQVTSLLENLKIND